MYSYIWFVGLIWLTSIRTRCQYVYSTTSLPALTYTTTRKRSVLATTPKAEALGGLIEHESCISLTHKRCWNPSSRLRTQREEGAGLGQITRAFRQDGSQRFDALEELKLKHPQALRELSWQTVYTRPDLQMRAIILKSRDNYTYYIKYSANSLEALAFADAAYNGGIGGLDNERRACKLAKDCDHTKWFGNVERFCLKSKAALYGQRSACDINRHHVKDVLLVRTRKYSNYLH